MRAHDNQQYGIGDIVLLNISFRLSLKLGQKIMVFLFQHMRIGQVITVFSY